MELLPDLLLSLMLLVLAASALFSPSLLGGSAAFVLFGVILALVWVRLRAIDLAIAEAAIGAGLTGILLFTAIARGTAGGPERISRTSATAAGAFLLTAAAIFGVTLSDSFPLTSALPGELAQSHVGQSGVSHPVTAVLLNFRGWDTFLELAVLLLALLGVRQLRPLHPPTQVRTWSLLLAWSKTLAPLLVLVGGYLLWRGSSRPGGAFQAGALIASGAAVLRLAGILPALHWRRQLIRALVLLSLIIFSAVAILTTSFGNGWLVLPQGGNTILTSGGVILSVEICATLSIALVLTLLVVGDERDLQS